MANKIDQKSYLQKYLNGPSGDKKKKKKKHVKGKGLRIVDDDIDLTKIRPLDGDELDLFDEGEDAPQIVGIVDERPEDVKKLEQFKTTSKWKVINQDDGFNSKLQIEEIKKDIKLVEKENELVFGKMYSDSEDEKKNDSDLSPPRKQTDNHERNDISPLQRTDKSKLERTKHNDDSDQSPPRKSKDKKMAKRKKNKEYDSDASPPRERSERKNKRLESQSASARSSDKKSKTYTGRDRDGDLSPSRRRDREQKSKNYDSDLSPPRRHEDRKTERPRKPTRWGDADDSTSHSRDLTRSDSPSDSINQRKSRRDVDRRSPSSDLSPPRKSQKVRHNKSPNSDLSPPRKRSSKPLQEYGRYSNDVSPTKKRRQSQSPGRKSKPHSSKRKNDSDSDMSPPRKGRNTHEKAYRRNSDSPPPTSKKMARTLDGKMAGLQDAKQLRRENEEFRRREEDVYTKMTDDVSGRNAKAVSRKSKRETSEEKQKHKEKAIRQKELDEKYKKWSRGVKQTEDQQSRVEDYLHEAAKPLARLRGDVDLEARLRQEERKGDPMLNYIRDKKRERGELGPEKPTYKGQYPPNRFDIRPGYRWDGVDRSNGYENKYFEQQSKRKAQEEEAYKWSTEDL